MAGGGQKISPRFCSAEWEGRSGSGKKAMLRDFQVVNVEGNGRKMGGKERIESDAMVTESCSKKERHPSHLCHHHHHHHHHHHQGANP